MCTEFAKKWLLFCTQRMDSEITKMYFHRRRRTQKDWSKKNYRLSNNMFSRNHLTELNECPSYNIESWRQQSGSPCQDDVFFFFIFSRNWTGKHWNRLWPFGQRAKTWWNNNTSRLLSGLVGLLTLHFAAKVLYEKKIIVGKSIWLTVYEPWRITTSVIFFDIAKSLHNVFNNM